MYARRLLRISFLVAAVLAFALSCSIDYSMDFDITGVAYAVGGYDVTVTYSMTNSGAYDMENAAINILVSINGSGPTQELWTVGGVELTTGNSVSDSLTFTFGTTVSSATAVIIGARWDKSTTFSE